MLKQNLNYIFGISGGPDSMFLLNKFLNFKSNIIVCHVNYNFRVDSKKDEKIVTNFCNKNGIKLFILNINQNYNDLKQNFEEFARIKRYDFFYQKAKEYNCEAIVLGHNLNDHIETYLMQMHRNGLYEYYGIQKESKFKEFKLLRPILDYKKSEILDYLNKNNISYAVDSTNLDDKYLRNSIRKNLKELDFKNYLEIIENANRKYENKKKFKIDDYKFKIGLLKEVEEQTKQIMLFNWIKKFDPEFGIEKRKRKTLLELLKQLESQKSYLEFPLENKVLIKDRDIIFLFDKSKMKLNLKMDNLTNWTDLEWIENIEEIKILALANDNLMISNDFKEYQKLFTYEGLKLQKFFLKNKTSYEFKLKNFIVYKEKSLIILNYW